MSSVLSSTDLRGALRSLSQRFEPLRPALRAQRHWLIALAIVLPAIVVAVRAGREALAQTEAHLADARELRRVREQMELWTAGYRPAMAEESLSWQRSEQALQPLTAPAGDVTALASLLSDRAEQVGVERLHVGMIGPDSVSLPPPRPLGPWRAEPGSSAMSAAFEADYATIQNFVGVVPPQLEIIGIELGRGDEGLLRTRLILVPRQVVPEEGA